MAHSLTHLDQLDTSRKSSDTGSTPSLLRKKTLASWNGSIISHKTDNRAKYYDKLMKPLQMSQKRRIVLSISKKANPQTERGLFQNLGYDDFMLRVSELGEISKLHEDYVTAKNRKKILEEIKDDDHLKNNLTDRAYRCVQLARERSISQQSYDNSQFQLPALTSDSRDDTPEQEIELEEKQQRLASYLSLSKERKTAKQLNNNAHFRHASRKVLMLRAKESVANRHEALESLLTDVNMCTRRNVSLSSEDSPFKLTSVRPQKKINEPLLAKVSQIDVNFYGTPLLPSLVEIVPEKQEKEASPLKATSTWLNLQEPPNNGHEDLSLFKSPIWRGEPETVKNNRGGSSKILEYDETPAKLKTFSFNDFRLNRATTFDTFSSLSQGLKSKPMLFQTESEASSGLDKSLKRVGTFTTKQEAQSKEQKQNIFKTEIEMILEDDDVKAKSEFKLVSSVNKIIKSTKPFQNLKHIRGASHTFLTKKSLQIDNEPKSTGKLKVKTPRKKLDGEESPVIRTVQELIGKSYRGETPIRQRAMDKNNMQEVLNSYGFEDTIGDITSARPKGRFTTLEGYQRQYFKDSIAKSERLIDKSLKRNTKTLNVVK